MSIDALEHILQELKKPFHPAHIFWKPGSITKDQARALAMAYADLRAYQNRLDEVCGLDWAVTYTAWGDRIICHLTIHGITRSSTGEPDSQAERTEIAGTAAEAQAFKRACSMFGLGRYLYQLPTVWVEYDGGAKQFTDKARDKLKQIIVQHYWRTSHVEAGKTEVSQAGEASTQTSEPDSALEELRQQFDQLGQELYSAEWEQVCRHNVERITTGQTSDPTSLSAEQLQKLIKGMQQVKRKRRSGRVGQRRTQDAA